PVAAGAGDRELYRCTVERKHRVDHDVEALARNEPRQPQYEGPVGVEPEPGTGRGASFLPERPEPLCVDAGRDDDAFERPSRDARRLPGGIAAGGDNPCRGADDPAAAAAREREARGNRYLGAVRDHDVRRTSQPGTDEAERQHRVEKDHVRTDLARELVDV